MVLLSSVLIINGDGSNYRYGNFPSVSVGWNIAEEDFVKNSVSWLDQLKLRGGYGVLGNQEIDNYQYVSVVTTGINYPDGKSGLIQGAFPKTFANPDIKWERTSEFNGGLDYAFFNHRLFGRLVCKEYERYLVECAYSYFYGRC